MTLELAIARIKAGSESLDSEYSEVIGCECGVHAGDLIDWLTELKERREADGNEYAMKLIRKQWEAD